MPLAGEHLGMMPAERGCVAPGVYVFPVGDELASTRKPFVNWALIATCLAVFAYQSSLSEFEQRLLFRERGLVPAEVLAEPFAQGWRLLSHAFIHASLMHLGGNMLFLWTFGRNVEQELGHAGYLAFYLVGGALAGLASIATDASSTVPGIGASGAIAAVLAAYLVLHPFAGVRIFVLPLLPFSLILQQSLPIFAVPAWAALVAWFGMQVVGGLSATFSPSGVDYAAHLGGFAAGYAIVRGLRLGGYWPDHAEPGQPVPMPRHGPTHYVVARRMLREGDTVASSDLQWVKRRHEYVEEDAVPAARLGELEGRRLLQSRYPLEAIRWSDLELVAAPRAASEEAASPPS
jgi:membrane associated rhomboid family serine protease